MRLSHFAALILVVPALGCSVKSKPMNVQAVEEKVETFERCYVVAYPAKAKSVETKTLATAIGNQTLFSERCSKNDVYYTVSYTDYPEAYGQVSADTILDGIRDGMKGPDGKVAQDEKLKFEGGEGRLMRITAGKNEIRAKAILMKRRLYLVEVCGTTESMKTADPEKFLGSFEPTK